MIDNSNLFVTVENLTEVYKMLYTLCPPPITENEEDGMVLSIINGKPAWGKIIINSGGGEQNPDEPNPPIDDGYTYLTNSDIIVNSKKTTYGSATWTYNETTHDLAVTFTNYSQGILLGSWTSADTIQVFFDSVEYSTSISDTAKLYIGLYDNKAVSTQGYDNTSGMTAAIDTTPGVQINSSSKYVTNGGVVPITVTYKNIRFLVNA